MKNRQLVIFSLIIMNVVLNGNLFSGEKTDPAIISARDKALSWLKKQKVPNTVISDPQPDRRNLVLSYEIDSGDPAYKYIAGRSIIYDDALAVIALTMNKDYKTASQILLALERLQRKDGGLWFGYNTHNDWPSEDSHEGATERTGASAWVGYSAVYYINSRIADEPSFLKSNRESNKILKLAVSLADYLMKKQVKQKKDLRYGLITGGKNSYTLSLQANGVEELFSETDISWVSAEHNIDSYFFLRDLGLLTGEKRYIKSAEILKESMLTMWSAIDRQYYRGIKPGYIDEVLALDCASWGAVFSISAGKIDYAKQSLVSIENLYASRAESLKSGKTVYGYKPYAVKEIYEEVKGNITQHYFPDLKGSTWDLISGVWVEGSMGVALAYLKTGNRDKAEEIITNMLPLQDQGGGFIYFTREIPHEFSTYNSVASTAWFIIMATALESSSCADSFWTR